MPPNIRPLHVGKFVPPPFAGMETHVDTLLRSMAGQAQSTLIASQPSRVMGRALEPTPYRIVPVPYYAMLASVPFCPAILGAVSTELRQQRGNLVHIHAPNPWADVAALRAPRDVPVVMTWHSDIVRQQMLLKLYGPMQQKALQRADRIIVFTPKHYESSAQLQQARIEHKVHAVPIGIDFAQLDETPSDDAVQAELLQWAAGRPIILTVGRHVYYKGYHHLLEAVAALQSDAVLLMIGAGPLSAELQRHARERQLLDRVKFLGEVSRGVLATALRTCDVFCLPSIERSEAFGIASAEAMACGKPTVVCDLDNGVNCLNRAGETSLLTPPRDERALADALDQMVRDDAMRTRMGAAANRWVRDSFGIDAMRDGTLALYKTLL